MASRGAALQVPESLKPIAPYIRIAAEHDSRNPVIAYWCRFYALATGLKVLYLIHFFYDKVLSKNIHCT